MSFAATYYVKNGGNDTADGLSDGNAWETIAKVNTFASSPGLATGDSINFNRGDVFNDATLGSPGADNITIQSYGEGDKPILDGDVNQPIKIDDTINNLTIKDIDISGQDWLATKAPNIDLDNINGITLDGIQGNGHRNYGGTNYAKNAIAIEYCSGTIEIKNCELYNWGPLDLPVANGRDCLAFHIKGHTSGTLSIHDNTVHDIQSDGTHRQYCTAPMIMYDNAFYNCGENAYDNKGSDNDTIYDNHFYRTPDFTGVGGQASDRWPLIHIHGQDGYTSENIEIYENTLNATDSYALSIAGIVGALVDDVEIYDNAISNAKGGVYVGNHVYTLNIHNNTFIDFVEGATIYSENNAGTGNTCYNNTFHSILNTIKGFDLAYSNTTFKNNIIYMNDSNSTMLTVTSGSLTWSYNDWYNAAGTGSTWINWKSTTYDGTEQAAWRSAGHTGGLFTDPLFTAAGDKPVPYFALQYGSPAIDTGANVGLDYEGAGPDMGAYEYPWMQILDVIPSCNSTGVSITADLNWTNPTGTVSIDLLFDKKADHDPPTTVELNDQDVETWDCGTLDYDTEYAWRVDINHAGGTETGSVYYFTTTSQANPPIPSVGMSYHPGGVAGNYHSSGVNVK